MIETYKILTGKYDAGASSGILLRAEYGRTRGHQLKLQKGRCRTNHGLHRFSHRVVDKWNSLPEAVITAPSVVSFERRLDKHWHSHPLRWDHTAPEMYNWRHDGYTLEREEIHRRDELDIAGQT